ncbi:OLC1v1001510C1 [Oldenlandia corymbosa var. corymbosa]|uniref:OLC1v1001510C1 n=1 Tax=Oldenlandia corymbosa var. corymbosa TaxID=529605 RepID=A0AAV1D885_OLDCO|nr:OLC1v1001510C1 [Oldenlandia corymbosa var. corymbosa]
MAKFINLSLLILMISIIGFLPFQATAVSCGGSCRTLNDCDGQLICINGKCNDDPDVGTHICSGSTSPSPPSGSSPSPSGTCLPSGSFTCNGQTKSTYTCSPQVTGSTPATFTLNDFGPDGDGGAPSECDESFHDNSERVVALSTGWYANGARCGMMIRITAGNGRSTTAKVVDECDSMHGCDEEHAFQPPCDNNIVDGSDAVWKALGLNENLGRVPVTCHFKDDPELESMTAKCRIFGQMRGLEGELMQLKSQASTQKREIQELTRTVPLTVLSEEIMETVFEESLDIWPDSSNLEGHTDDVFEILELLLSENRLNGALSVLEMEGRDLEISTDYFRINIIGTLSGADFRISTRFEVMSTTTATTSVPTRVTSSGPSTTEAAKSTREIGAASTLPLPSSGVPTLSVNQNLEHELRSSYDSQFHQNQGAEQTAKHWLAWLNAQLGLDQRGRTKESAYNTPQDLEQIIIGQQNNTITSMLARVAALEQSFQKVNPNGGTVPETPSITPDASLKVPLLNPSTTLTHDNPLFSNSSTAVQGLSASGVSQVGVVPEITPIPNPSWYYCAEQSQPAFIPPVGNFTFDGAVRWPPKAPGYPSTGGFTPPRGIIPPPRLVIPPNSLNGQNSPMQNIENPQTQAIPTPMNVRPVPVVARTLPTANPLPHSDQRFVVYDVRAGRLVDAAEIAGFDTEREIQELTRTVPLTVLSEEIMETVFEESLDDRLDSSNLEGKRFSMEEMKAYDSAIAQKSAHIARRAQDFSSSIAFQNVLTIREVAKYEFSMISQAARSFLGLHGEGTLNAPELIQWSKKKTQVFAVILTKYVESTSEISGGLSAMVDISVCIVILLMVRGSKGIPKVIFDESHEPLY